MHPLDFRCSGSGRTVNLDRLLSDVDSQLEAARSLVDTAAAEHDFRLERSVVEADSDLPGTLGRLHAS